jgi:hypothetical protein
MNEFPVPILFTIYNRKGIAFDTFQRIREVRPAKLFIAADGPKPEKPGDAEKCAETREVAAMVDWPCEVKTLFRPANLGLKKGMSSAIRWFFENVEEGIVLEDDCKPELSFFGFCAWALDAYRGDARVMAVCGTNYQFGVKRGEASLYFSKILACWGWATWRRAWNHFDLEMKSFPEFERTGQIRNVFPHRLPQEFWMAKMGNVHRGANSWAFAWIYAIIANGGLVAVPNENLVANVGFGEGGTNATDEESVFSNMKTGTLGGRFIAPPFILADNEADLLFTRIVAKEQFAEGSAWQKAKNAIKRVLPKALLPRR